MNATTDTMPHLANNGGVRAHSASLEFAKTGITRFCTLDHGAIKHWGRYPDGRVFKAKQ